MAEDDPKAQLQHEVPEWDDGFDAMVMIGMGVAVVLLLALAIYGLWWLL